jgi:hypothetical protein
MFESLKNALGLGDAKSSLAGKLGLAPHSDLAPASKVSEWAGMQGFVFSQRADGRSGYHVEGKVGGKAWRMEQGKPSRDFIQGAELRARAELGIRDDVAVMVMSRQLKNDLDKRAFAIYTDTLQTIADPNLPEEMRWLSIYEEVGWESLGKAFLNQYAVLADNRLNAVTWLNQELVNLLMAWPTLDPAAPKILMLLRGKAYLRMQATEDDLPTLEHATQLFTTACELALSGLSTDLAL